MPKQAGAKEVTIGSRLKDLAKHVMGISIEEPTYGRILGVYILRHTEEYANCRNNHLLDLLLRYMANIKSVYSDDGGTHAVLKLVSL
jgi:hypothetical protein